MRHNKAGKKFGRNSSWRKATVRDIARSVLKHERITTTEVKAKESRKLVDQLITLGKKQTLAAKRMAFKILCDHRIVKNLFDRTKTSYQHRQGGYTRIIPLAQRRRGDNAQMAILELTEKTALPVEKKAVVKKGTSEKKISSAKTNESGSPDLDKSKETKALSKHKKELPSEKTVKKVKKNIKSIFKQRTSEK